MEVRFLSLLIGVIDSMRDVSVSLEFMFVCLQVVPNEVNITNINVMIVLDNDWDNWTVDDQNNEHNCSFWLPELLGAFLEANEPKNLLGLKAPTVWQKVVCFFPSFCHLEEDSWRERTSELWKVILVWFKILFQLIFWLKTLCILLKLFYTVIWKIFKRIRHV